jgi:kexin
VSHDPTNDDSEGHFLGWSLSLWGSTIDSSKVKQWTVPKLSNVFPPLHPDEAELHPVASASISDAATSTKVYTNPTAALPDNHTDHEGEAEHPAFPAKPISSAAATPTPSGDWVSDTKEFVSDQKYLLGVLAIMFVLLAVTGVCLQRKLAARRRRRQYAALPEGDSVAMRAVARRGPDVAREDGSDDEDADEETGLRPGLGFHSGFLDDDAASPRPSQHYKDDPDDVPKEGRTRERRQSASDDSESGSGSGESWGHASKEV